MVKDEKCRFTLTLKKSTVNDLKALANKMGISVSNLSELLFTSVCTESADGAFATFIDGYKKNVR